MEEVLKLKIPASTANLGVGFDSIGMALDKYLHMSIRKIEKSNWEFLYYSSELEGLPKDENNYIYQTALNVAHKYNVTLPSLQIEMRSDIPLSKYELLQLATEIEGHPDNVAPTIYGGLIAGFYNPITKITDVARIEVPHVDIILTIPPYELRTEDSRRVLPDTFSHKGAVQNSAISNTMICALIQHKYKLAGKMMEQDGFHEPYRQHLIPEFNQVRKLSRQHDAYATVISGAGPTILTLCPKEKSGKLVRTLREKINNCASELVTINEIGVKDEVVYLKS